jgi:hypothetical protein
MKEIILTIVGLAAGIFCVIMFAVPMAWANLQIWLRLFGVL